MRGYVLFLGIDLGWHGKPSGLAALASNTSGKSAKAITLRLTSLDRRSAEADILAWVRDVADTHDAIVGVDAPLVIANPAGMRDCDKAMHHHYGKYHAGAYPANLVRPFAA